MLILRLAGFDRYCCKSPFALMIKNFPGRGRDFHVKMWGTSWLDDKLASDLGNPIEATRIGGRLLIRLLAGKSSSGNFGLLQQYLPLADICGAAKCSQLDHLVGAGERRNLRQIGADL